MSASQHSRRVSAEWFRKRSHQLRDNPALKQKVDAILALRTGVWGEEYQAKMGWAQEQREEEEMRWRDSLIHFACLAVSPHQGRPAILERHWAYGTGKTWKALKKFPKKLEAIAEEVQRITSADTLFFARRRRNDLERGDLERLGRTCEQLPETMRSYAAALRERNAQVETASPLNYRSIALFDLTQAVKMLTGAYRDNYVVELLNEADVVLNPPDPKGRPKFSEQTLLDLRFRQKTKPRRT